MAAFTPVRIKGGWRLEVKAKDKTTIVLEMVSPHLEREQLPATPNVSTDAAICYRNTVNLTSERARSRIIARLAEKKIPLDETPLIALDQACRTWTPPGEKAACDGGPDVSEKVRPHSLAELEEVF